jgi:Fe-S cluster biogenesis protein NfuA
MIDAAAADDPSTRAQAPLDDPAVRARLAVLNEQLAQLEATPGPVRELALTALAGLADIYGQALARTLDLADPAAVNRMLDDELIGHLLALHGIHPEPVQARLARVIERLRAALTGQGGTIELDRLDDGVAVVRVSARGCGSGSDVEYAVRRAVLTAVPELADVTIVSGGRSGAAAAAFVPLDALMRTANAPARPA